MDILFPDLCSNPAKLYSHAVLRVLCFLGDTASQTLPFPTWFLLPIH